MLTLLALLLFVVHVAYAGNWNTNVRALVTERLDPIVSPNNVASHMHAIIGGSAFGASYNYDDSMKSSCTSFPITVDKSNYWMPKLYWINKGGQSFTPIPQGHRVYYFRSKSSPNSTIQAFPKGLRMLAGNPNNKTPNTLATNYICRVDSKFMGPGDVQTDNFNIDKECPKGLLVQVKFPSCWDGVNLYKSDQSHMSYPVSSGATWGPCPWSHPIRLPSIMLEYYFQTSTWAPGQPLKGNLAWANGDTTGYGAHADFTNGWDVNVLQKALVDPVCGADQDMTFQECPVFKSFIKDAACSPDKGQMAESTGNADLVPISALPGCNKLWASGPKPTCANPSPSPDVAKYTGVDEKLVAEQSQQLVLPTVPGWKALGCIQDNDNMLLNETRYNDANVTQSTCFDSCLRSGYSYSAIGKMWGNTWDCHCGTGVSSTASTYPGMCNLTCPGNPSQACGGSGAHQVFYAPNATKPIASFTSNLGCYADPPAGNVSLESKASYNFTSWDKMTTGLCLQACADRGLGWGATRNGATCFCGSNEAFTLGKGNWVSPGTCNSKCSGNATESCGFWNGANVFNVSTMGYKQGAVNKPPGYLYCFSGGNTSLSGPQFGDGALTPQRCSYSCYELGYSLAAVWNANTCMCGNNYQGGGQLPMAMCSGKCPGNSSTTCGGQWNIGELYNTSAQASVVQASKAARPAGWQGCYANGDTLLKDYVVSDGKMTVEKCLSSCDELGYPFAGLQGQSQCRCSKTGPTAQTAPIASNVYCNLACSGNATETCGGWGRVEVYKITPSQIPGGSNATPGYKGCFNGTAGLTSYTWTNWNTMTVDACTKGCRELGYGLSSLYNRAICSCGNKWVGGAQLSSLSCSQNCTGNNAQLCGGWPTFQSVYDTSVGVPVSFPKEYKGCYNDSLPTKILTGYSIWLNEGNSVTSCRSICSAKNFAFAGSENSNGCYCGNTISSTAVRQTSDLCSSPCPANSAQKCGAWNYMSIYAADGDLTAPLLSSSSSSKAVSTSLSAGLKSNNTSSAVTSSATSSTSVTTSKVSTAPAITGPTNSAASSSSLASSATASQSKASAATPLKVVASGVSSSSNSFSSSISPKGSTSSAASASAKMSSSASSIVKSLASMTSIPSSSKPSTTSLSSVSVASKPLSSISVLRSSSSSSTSTAISSSASSAPTGVYKGCYQKGSYTSNAKTTTSLTGMTVDFCRRYCRFIGTSDAALGGGTSCSCGSSSNLGTLEAESSCSTKCPGNETESCGSTNQLSVYSTNITATAQLPSSYLGCFDASNSTAVFNRGMPQNVTTPESCRSMCGNFAFRFYGLLGGKSCYCGKALPSVSLVANNLCSLSCSGGGSGVCGGSSGMAVYGFTI